MYAQLCKRLSKEAPNFDSPSQTCTFLRILLSVCRDKFLNRSKQIDVVDHDGPLTPDEEERRHIAKQKMLGNVKFIGELSKLQMLSEGSLHQCIKELLDGSHRPKATIQDRCEDMECLNQLIRTCGKNLDTEQGKKLMDQYFDKMDSRSKSQKYPPRIRFMLRDLIELRENNWVPRKVSTTEGPVPIRQLRNDDEDNIIRPTFVGRREMRNNERDSDSWMNKFSLTFNLNNYDVFNGLGVNSQPPHSMSSGYNSNRNHNPRNNQNSHNNYNNRFNKHNNNHNQHNMHNNSSYLNMMSNKDLAPRFKRNLITAAQETVENSQKCPPTNSLLFKGINNMKSPSLLPMNTPPLSLNSSSSSYNSPSNNPSNNYTNSNPILRPFASSTPENTQLNSTISNAPALNPVKPTQPTSGNTTNNSIPNNISNKDAGMVKQNSTEKPTKQNKKDKGPNKEEILKRVLVFLGENLTDDNDSGNEKNMDDIIAAFYEIKVPDKFMKDACILILNETIDKPEQQYDRCIELLQQLRKANKLSVNGLIEAFRQIVIKMNEKEITIPRITTLVASLLGRAVRAKLCKLSDVAAYTENGQHYPLFLLVLQHLHKTMGKSELSELFNSSKIDLMATLSEADKTKDRMAAILEDRNLSFLYPLLKVQSEMLKQINTEPNPTSFYKWIKENVDSTNFTHPGFITALMNVLLKYITQETTLAEGTDVKKNPEKPIAEKEQTLLKKYSSVLLAFLSGNNDLQLIALYALQVFCYNAKFPKGMLCRWFTNLYDLNVIEEEAFLRWKEEITDVYPGKGEALFQVNTWLTWLEQAESEEED